MSPAIIALSLLITPADASVVDRILAEELAPDPTVERVHGVLLERAQGFSPEELRRCAEEIVAAAADYDLDPNLILAVIHVETRFKRGQVSRAGARGLMQVMPRTGEEVAERIDLPWDGAATLFDPVANIRIGAAYLARLEARFGSELLALTAYCHGALRLRRLLRRGGVPEDVLRYGRRVLGFKQALERSEERERDHPPPGDLS